MKYLSKLIYGLLVIGFSGISNSCDVKKSERQLTTNITVEQQIQAEEAFNSILGSYVDSTGFVDYQALRDNPFQLYEFVKFVNNVSPENHPESFRTEDDKKAYWINAYNALVMQAIVENPDVVTIKDISWGRGVFWRKKYIVGGEQMTLNYIENKILRKKYHDPRIHFAINCASKSCPPLGNRIVSGDNLDSQLEMKASQFIQEDLNVKIDFDRKVVWLSQIFKWYKKDFTGTGMTLLEYITRYLPNISESQRLEIVKNYSVRYFKYDWSLNTND